MLSALFPFHVVLTTALGVQGVGSTVGIIIGLLFPRLILHLSIHTTIALGIFGWLFDADRF